MESSYKDKTLALQGRRFGSLDPGREVGALVNLFSEEPLKVPWQSRALLEKLLTVVRARKRKKTLLYFGRAAADLELPCVSFMYHRDIGGWLSLVLCNYKLEAIYASKLWLELWKALVHRVHILTDESDLSNFVNADSFCIYVIGADELLKQEQILSFFSDGQEGVMFVKDFSLKKSKFIAESYRRAGLSITESADGYGECWSL